HATRASISGAARTWWPTRYCATTCRCRVGSSVRTSMRRITWLERVVREDRQAGDAVADPVVGRLQRGLAQVLLVGRLQHVVGQIAGAQHDQIAVVHRLGN